MSGYQIVGIDHALARDLANGLALQGRRRFLRRERVALTPSLLEDDLRRTALFMARNGYPRARLSPRIDPASDGQSITITIDIETGDAVRVGEIALDDFPAADEWATPDLQRGMRVVDARIDTAAGLLKDQLRARGYAFAVVQTVVEPMDSTRVRVRYLAESGLRYRFGGVRVKGTRDDLVRLVERIVTIPEGTRYSPRMVEQIEERIRLLELFRRVQIGLESRPDSSRLVDLLIDLADLDMRSIEAALGVRTDEGVLLRAGWLHRNLLGGGRGLRTQALYSSHLRSLTARLWFPGLFRADLRQEITAGAEWQREEIYDLDKYEVEFSSRYHHSYRSTAQGGIRESITSYRQLSADGDMVTAKDEVVSLLFATLNIDGSDNRLDPQRGWVTSIRAESTVPVVRSDARYAVAEASLAMYRQMLGSVGAVRVRAGRAWALGGTAELPPDVRFYAGGATSMRGFGRRKLGPLDSEGNPLGGAAIVEAGFELRVPIVRPVVVAGFLDAGQVWREAASARMDELEVALGAGLRIATPVGYVRFDVARRLTSVITGQPMTAYHLALGQPF